MQESETFENIWTGTISMIPTGGKPSRVVGVIEIHATPSSEIDTSNWQLNLAICGVLNYKTVLEDASSKYPAKVLKIVQLAALDPVGSKTSFIVGKDNRETFLNKMIDKLQYESESVPMIQTKTHSIVLFKKNGNISGLAFQKRSIILRGNVGYITCVICEKNKACYAVVPCGHIPLCEEHSKDRVGTECVICGQEIVSCIKICDKNTQREGK